MSSSSGGGQMTAVMLDKALPATRLLEKRRLMFQVQEALEHKKLEFARKEEELTKREDALRLKDRELQESLIGFSKFLQENNVKRLRAEKKSADEVKLIAEKEAETRELEVNLEQLQLEKVVTKHSLENMMAYQKYLEKVIDVANEYHEINDLLTRYSTLASTNEDLTKRVEESTDMIETLRADLQSYCKSALTEILNLENDISCTKQDNDKTKRETADMQKHVDSVLQVAAGRTLSHGQVCMTAENLFMRVCQLSKIKHPAHTDPLKRFDVVGDYITDTHHIIRSFKINSGKEQLAKDDKGL
ncbi:hypothetical protein O6H91_06G093800 [Diphasiastrum complanatum]|uniref:Uncharacterized protein n=1 Tax=Diphasiastrum complanatum TaxID=34168 RepID=A0ACC2DG69_DIPCM|nr:hypothetical protein O6H91_06G093800 [Diphasiastrum complanatum]